VDRPVNEDPGRKLRLSDHVDHVNIGHDPAMRTSITAVAAVVATLLLAAPAHAAWTTVQQVGSSVLLACKTPESGGYGPVWKITLVLANSQAHERGGATVDVRRGGALVSRTQMNTWAPGQWDVKTTYASRWFTDRLSGAAGFGNAQGQGAGGSFDLGMGSIGSC
jgi:hypothetical protein